MFKRSKDPTPSRTAVRKKRFSPFKRKKNVTSDVQADGDNVNIDVSRGHNIPLSEIVEGATKKDMVGNTEYTPSSINLVNPPEIVSKAQPQSFEPVKTEESIIVEGTGGNLQGKKAFFTKSKMFKNMVDKAFVNIDADGSGEIDKKELYAGLILIHLRLAAYVGAAACRPASKEYVEEIFDSLDKDGTGTLDRNEFQTVMAILASQMTTRILLYMLAPLVIIPLIAQGILDVFEKISLGEKLAKLTDSVADVFITDGIQEKVTSFFDQIEDFLPDDFWESLPMTIIAALLACIALPYAVLRADEYFSGVAGSKKKEKKN